MTLISEMFKSVMLRENYFFVSRAIYSASEEENDYFLQTIAKQLLNGLAHSIIYHFLTAGVLKQQCNIQCKTKISHYMMSHDNARNKCFQTFQQKHLNRGTEQQWAWSKVNTI